jgi:hypothetical protein
MNSTQLPTAIIAFVGAAQQATLTLRSITFHRHVASKKAVELLSINQSLSTNFLTKTLFVSCNNSKHIFFCKKTHNISAVRLLTAQALFS